MHVNVLQRGRVDVRVATNSPHSALSGTLKVYLLPGFSLNALRSIPPHKIFLDPTQLLCWNALYDCRFMQNVDLPALLLCICMGANQAAG